MKRITNLIVFGFFVLAGLTSAEVTELVKNYNFRMAPEMKDGPDVENHGGAWVWHVPAGKTGIPDWEVSGTLQLWQMKSNNRRVVDLMGGKGSLSQTFATTPGKWYFLVIRSAKNGEGGQNQTLSAAFNGQVRTYTEEQLGYQSLRFQAKKASTTLVFTGKTKNGGRGPVLYSVRCEEFDPEADKIQIALSDAYREMDRGEKSESDIPKLMSHLTEDFSYKPAEGPALDRAGFEELVRQRVAKKFKVNTAIEEVIRNDDGTVTVEVERRQQEPGEYGKLIASAPHFKQTWVKAGGAWMLKSSEEMASSQ